MRPADARDIYGKPGRETLGKRHIQNDVQSDKFGFSKQPHRELLGTHARNAKKPQVSETRCYRSVNAWLLIHSCFAMRPSFGAHRIQVVDGSRTLWLRRLRFLLLLWMSASASLGRRASLCSDRRVRCSPNATSSLQHSTASLVGKPGALYWQRHVQF